MVRVMVSVKDGRGEDHKGKHVRLGLGLGCSTRTRLRPESKKKGKNGTYQIYEFLIHELREIYHNTICRNASASLDKQRISDRSLNA
jgi:hypothetical protein